MTSQSYVPDSGNIIWLDLNPRTGHEQSGRRPYLVLSSRLYAERTGMAVVCPITSKIKGLPFEVKLTNLQTAGVILPIHVKSVDLEARNAKFIEQATHDMLQKTRQYVAVIIGCIENAAPK